MCNYYLALVPNGKTRAKKSRSWLCVFDDTFSIVNVMRLTWNFLHLCPKLNWRENANDRMIFLIFSWLLWPPFERGHKWDTATPRIAPPFAPLNDRIFFSNELSYIIRSMWGHWNRYQHLDKRWSASAKIRIGQGQISRLSEKPRGSSKQKLRLFFIRPVRFPLFKIRLRFVLSWEVSLLSG